MKVVIVGSGQAGGWFAQTLKDAGFAGEVVLVGEELHPPYQRPPLSKEVLLGKIPPDATYLWPSGSGEGLRIFSRAGRIDRTGKRLELSDGSTIGYDKLILATGGRVRRLDIPGAHYLRTIEDSMSLRASLLAGGEVVVVGGGWIGLEAAAAARELGCAVTVLEAADRLCARVAPHCVADYLHGLHERHGVRIELNAKARAHGDATVVVGIGIIPNVELAQEAGLQVANGIVVDALGVTSDPDILAVGDVANLGGVRLETWANAQNQAIAAAKSLAGTPTPYSEVPWFWSTQYEVNMQFLGLPDARHTLVTRGDPTKDKFTLFFLEGQRLAAVMAANNMRDIRVSKRLIERKVVLDPAMLADESVTLQDLLG